MPAMEETRRDPLVVTTLPSGHDNYIYVVRWDGGSAVVDPGDAEPVLA